MHFYNGTNLWATFAIKIAYLYLSGLMAVHTEDSSTAGGQ
jgi:hypothetical protein